METVILGIGLTFLWLTYQVHFRNITLEQSIFRVGLGWTIAGLIVVVLKHVT